MWICILVLFIICLKFQLKKLYTPLFATARIAGWAAHRIEELISAKRIIRPAYKPVKELKYLTLSER